MPAVGTTHDVKIGGQYFLIRPGSYRKRPAPLFGPRFSSGDPNYNNLSFWQHWAQTCWVGGLDAETWVDDAMFDQSVGVNTTVHEQMTLARDLGPTSGRTTYGWDLGGATGALDGEFIQFNGTLYLMRYGTTGNSKLFKYDPTLNANDGGWTLVHAFPGVQRSMCVFGGYLWFGSDGANIDKMSTAETFTQLAKPSGRTETPYTMKVFRDYLYVSFGRYIYRLKSDFTWDGSTAFYEAVGVNYLHASETHLGFLYLASQNGHILRTDGNATFDIWQWDGGVTPRSLRSYDGRLFVSTTEASDASGGYQGVLYQFSGSALTELKRWGRIGWRNDLGRMRVVTRRLYYGAPNLLGQADGFGVAVYDSLEDAHSVWASNRDTTTYSGGTYGNDWLVDDIYYHGQWLFVQVRGHGVFRTKLYYRDVKRNLASYDAGQGNGGWIESSDFDGGTAGLLKLWRQVQVHVDLPSTACSVVVEYSLDGGGTWTTAGTVTKTGSGTRYNTAFKLNNITGTRFKYRLTLKTTDSTKTPVVHGVIVSYLPLPEPNWQWEMVLIVSDQQELHDGTIDTPNVATVTQTLENQYRAQQLVNFVDVDGTEWVTGGQPGVVIADIQKDVAYLGPTADGDVEAAIRVVLHEAVESY